MADEDDIDYMSDQLIPIDNDIKPGLNRSHQQQREFEQFKEKSRKDRENRTRYQPYKVIEEKHRTEGLSQKLSHDNKGFALLQKMGYKEGDALGKTNPRRSEPIAITIKTDKKGLGLNTVLKEIAEKKAAIRKRNAEHKNSDVDFVEFRKLASEKYKHESVLRDLRKSQRVCQEFDSNLGWTQPIEVWYWPSEISAPDKCESDGSPEPQSSIKGHEEPEESTSVQEEDVEMIDDYDYSEMEKLEILTIYLRKTYFYCIWCGVKYENEQDLGTNCPGSTKDDH